MASLNSEQGIVTEHSSGSSEIENGIQPMWLDAVFAAVINVEAELRQSKPGVPQRLPQERRALQAP